MPLSFTLTKALYEGDLEKAITLYKLKKINYSTNEYFIKDIAQQLSWSGQNDKVIMVFELNVSIFTDSPAAHIQLSEADKQQGALISVWSETQHY